MNSDDTDRVIPLVQEVARIDKRRVASGKVSVRTAVDTETERLHASLSVQTVRVERVPFNKKVEKPPEIREEGNVTIIPIIEERLIATKELYLIEEIRIVRATTVEDIDVPVELRKQRAIIKTDGE